MVSDRVRPATMQPAWRAEEELDNRLRRRRCSPRGGLRRSWTIGSVGDDVARVAAWRTAGYAIFNFADETNLNGPAQSGDGAGPPAKRAG